MQNLSVLIWGSDPLGLDLARALDDAGHRVAACVTRSPELAAWADERRVTTMDAEAARALPDGELDWLVVTDLGSECAADLGHLARRGIVGLTDIAPSGVDRPQSRALDAGARHRTIAWQIVGEEEALLLHEIEIEADDTAGALARRCRSVATAGLPALIAALEAEDAPRCTLPEDARRMGPHTPWPPRAGFIDFAADTAAILRLVRALDPGAMAGGAMPKVLTDAGPLLVWGVCEAEAAGEPGEVIEAAAGTLVVATADGAVRLHPVTGPFGEEASLPVRGVRLGSPEVGPSNDDDSTWLARFADWRPARWGITAGPGGAPWSRVLPLPRNADMAAVLTAFPALVSAMCGSAPVDLALGHGPSAGATLGWVPLRFDPAAGWAAAGEALAAEVARLSRVPPVPADLPARVPEARACGMTFAALSLGGPVRGAGLTFAFGAEILILHADPRLVAPAEAALIAERLRHLLARLPDLAPEVPVADLPILPDAEIDLVLHGWNATDAPFDADATLHRLIAAKAARMPSAAAVTAEGATLTFAELERTANRLANLLREAGARPGTVVGLDLPRSADWIVAALATLKSGAAFLPLPPDRALPLDAVALVVAATEEASPWPAPTLGLDDPRLAGMPDTAPDDEATGDDLAYLTAAAEAGDPPPLVMVEHRNLTSLLVGLDERIATGGGVWLAIGEPAADTWIAETLGALVRGFEVVVGDAAMLEPPPPRARRHVALGLALSGDPSAGAWELAREIATYADQRGVSSLWTVAAADGASVILAAAAAASTAILPIRALVNAGGAARAVPDLAALEGLAPGRAGMGLAASGAGELAEAVALFPSGGAPLWVAVKGDAEDWRAAAALGCHVVADPLGGTVADLAERIADYRATLAEHGRDPAHTVTLILPTYSDEEFEIANAIAGDPLEAYLRAGLGEMDDAGSFGRLIDEWALLGSPEEIVQRLETLAAAGVDEVACLVDFGVPPEAALAGLVPLVELCHRMADAAAIEPEDHSLPTLLERHDPSHLHCTPATMRRLLDHAPTRAALGGLRQIVLSGGAVSGDLVAELAGATGAAIEVMQGWPETSVWSTSQPARGDQRTNGVGAPMANVQAYVLDLASRPCPVGVEGELWIGGAGIARGYWRRDDLTAERFKSDPFRRGGRLFRTGTRARWLADGTLDLTGAAEARPGVSGDSADPPGVAPLPDQDEASLRESVLLALASADETSER